MAYGTFTWGGGGEELELGSRDGAHQGASPGARLQAPSDPGSPGPT